MSRNFFPTLSPLFFKFHQLFINISYSFTIYFYVFISMTLKVTKEWKIIEVIWILAITRDRECKSQIGNCFLKNKFYYQNLLKYNNIIHYISA